jgi:hypothetical protein
MRRPRNLRLITNRMKLLSIANFLLLFSNALFAQTLSLEEVTKIKNSGPQVTTQKREGKVWPQVTVKAYIPADPIESAGIFAAFDYQDQYIPNLKKSEVMDERMVDHRIEVDVKYIMDMPWPISDSEYLNGHRLMMNEQTYKVEWYMIKNESADDLRGSATFSPFPNEAHATLMIYEAQVDPKSFLAGALKKFMVRDVKASVEATVNEVKKLKKSNPSLIKKYADKFREIVSGKRAYLLKS